MDKINSYVSISAGLLALASLVIVGNFGAGQAQGRVTPQVERTTDVRVVNTSTEPVPVLNRGTTNVSGSISVTNTPTVNLAPGAHFGIDPSSNAVQIANAESAPAAVRDADFGRHPFSQSADFSFPVGAITRSSSITVPAGKRLVIEYVSGHFAVPTGQNITKIALGVTLDQQFANHFVTRLAQGDSGLGGDVFGASQQLRVYADGLFINVQRSDPAGTAGGTVSVTGYLVAAP